jgi:hypothetical protein
LITATGNITGGNLSGTSISGTLTTAAQTNITSVGTLSSLSVSGNITGGNISTAGMLSGATLETTSNAIIGGNLTVNGNVVYVNITDLNVQDPIIGIGRGANNAPLTTDDGKDRGEQLWYYTDSEKSAFIGYDNSADKLIAALDVSIVNEIVTVNSYGSFVVGTLESTTASASGNITGGNLLTGGLISSTGNITSGNIITGGLISATGNITGGNILGNGAGLSGINAFSNISVSGGNSVTADSISDTLTLTAGDGITLVADAGNNIITIAQAGSGDSIFATGGDMGTVTETVTASEDLGLITTVAATEIDMGTVVTSGLLYPDQLVLPTKTVAQLANTSASPAGQFVFCSNESGGSIPAFSDGTNWRRVSDRAIVT